MEIALAGRPLELCEPRVDEVVPDVAAVASGPAVVDACRARSIASPATSVSVRPLRLAVVSTTWR